MITFKTSLQKGFTIIELIVVITIFSILVTVALFNFQGFNESIALSNLSQQIAMFVKKAQTAGSLGRLPAPNLQAIALGFNPKWVPTYGIHFEKGNPFCYFVDLDSPNSSNYKKYNGTGSCGFDEGLEETALQAGYQIADLQANEGLVTNITNLDISFTRPNLSAAILADGIIVDQAEIYISSPKGKQKKIVIHRIGQISVENVP
ncbi:MAG TPA: type II secretion system protein [Candidatus Paceibacterota bacterium]|nr:type II secretion system protein [Candidatus Paceibacterota bacterium]